MWINCCCCWVTTLSQERDLIAFTAGLPTSVFSYGTKFSLYLSFPVHFLSFPIISCSKTNKQERKKGRSGSWSRAESHLEIKLQTSWKKLKKDAESRLSRLYVSTPTFSVVGGGGGGGGGDAESRLSRLYVSTPTFSVIPPSPFPPPPPTRQFEWSRNEK